MIRLLPLAAALLLTGAAAAQDSPVGDLDREVTGIIGEDARLIVGGGLGLITQPYTGADAVRFVPEPLVIFQRDRLEFIGRTLGYEVWGTEHLSLQAIAEWRFFGHDAGGTSDFLEGMDERKGTGEVGLRARAEFGRGSATLTGRVDALSRHGGYEVEARTSYELSTWRPLSVRPNVGLRFQSSSLADYYFGVDPEEARDAVCLSGDCLETRARPAYEVDDVLTPFIGLTARQSVSPKVAVVGGFDLNFLDQAVEDSPIVDEDVQTFAFLGLIYVFGDADAIAAAE